MAIPVEDQAIHSRRNLVAAAATVLALVVFSAFAWRVYHYTSRIQSGELTEADLAFLQKYTASEALASAPIPEGEFDVATADDPSLGASAADAVLTIVEFADFDCPFSREESFVVRSLAAAFGDRVRLVYRDFPIAAGAAAGVRGTPTFFFNGVRVPGAIPEDTFVKLIERFTTTENSSDL